MAAYFRHFEPDLFDPREWARSAKRAGMKYMVLTTKHHDGFCLWDSKLTDYTSMNTPIGKDLVAEFVEVVRAEGLRVGFYHSLIDWHHPDFVIDGLHPRRDDPPEEIKRLNEGRDMARYRAYLHGQVAELLTGYGTVDYLFYDFSYKDDDHHDVWNGKGKEEWGSEELLALTRRLQPEIIVNDRLAIPHDASEIKYREIDPNIKAHNTGLGGQPPGTLTLTLPVVRPDVAVPVVELFLRQDT
ncbi:hypothetical protein FGK60_14180 [Streptomyces sp. DASNCL29]|nr:hypothetical protein FGK60_14180 [Streptomyces sp. DASNCL29]